MRKVIGWAMVILPLVALTVVGIIHIDSWGGALLVIPGIVLVYLYIWLCLWLLDK